MMTRKYRFQKFLLLWVGEFISTIGSGISTFGLSVYAYERTGSVTAGSIIMLMGFMPIVLFSLPAGLLADHFFEPLMRKGGLLAPYLGGILGIGKGRGMALMLLLVGIGLIVSGIMMDKPKRWFITIRVEGEKVYLLLFVMTAAFFVATSIYIVLQVTTSVDHLYREANPPHFIQLHKGMVDMKKLEEVAKAVPEVTGHRLVEMIDISGGSIQIHPMNRDQQVFDLADSVLDNGFVFNDVHYDKLLDMKNGYVEMGPGEIGVPLIYTSSYDIQIGDRIRLKENGYEKDFVVSAFVRDAQMNSTMCSSTRFLMNKEDFIPMKGQIGEIEYEIEYFFEDPSFATKFQDYYEKEELPANGQAITYSLMKLLSCFSYYMLSFIVGLIGFMIIGISVLCLRYAIKANLEKEVKEIGTLRAIGMKSKDVRNLYQRKYQMITVLGCLAGYGVFLGAKDFFAKQSIQTFGAASTSLSNVMIPILGIFFVYGIIMFSCKVVIQRALRITVREALVSGRQERESKRWTLLFSVVFIACVMILLPLNLFYTIGNPLFSTYMGAVPSDITIRLQTAEELELKKEMLREIIENMDEVARFQRYDEYKYALFDAEGELNYFRVKVGDYFDSGLQYLEGVDPINHGDIAFSYLNAKRFGVNVGDLITVLENEREKELRISGIYQDVTDGGYTAKMGSNSLEESDPELTAVEYTLFLENTDQMNRVMEQLSVHAPSGAKIMSSKEYIAKTMKSLYVNMEGATRMIWVVSILLIALITTLFLRMKLAQQYSQIAIQKAIGISSEALMRQYKKKAFVVASLALGSGVLVSNLFGEKLVSTFLSFSGMGLKSIVFMSNPWVSWGLVPFTIMTSILVVIHFVVQEIKSYQLHRMTCE